MRRREFITLSAVGLSGVVAGGLSAAKTSAGLRRPESIKIPLRFFLRDEAMIIAVAASRIFPTGEAGPGAREADVVIYIDRQLAGPWGRDRYRFTQEPFEPDAASEFGYQGKATPQEIYRTGLSGLKDFTNLPSSLQDERLSQIESGAFFALLRRNTIEGMFCDPIHGGNRDMAGWRLIGFPGPRMSNYEDIDQHAGVAFRPEPVSLRQVVARRIHRQEDEP
jgi:gluconate 2-dehydrogenase gamma chain